MALKETIDSHFNGSTVVGTDVTDGDAYLCPVVSSEPHPADDDNEVSTTLSGYPLHRENMKMFERKCLSRETQGIWKCCRNTGNIQGILYAQVIKNIYCDICHILHFTFFF